MTKNLIDTFVSSLYLRIQHSETKGVIAEMAKGKSVHVRIKQTLVSQLQTVADVLYGEGESIGPLVSKAITNYLSDEAPVMIAAATRARRTDRLSVVK